MGNPRIETIHLTYTVVKVAARTIKAMVYASGYVLLALVIFSLVTGDAFIFESVFDGSVIRFLAMACAAIVIASIVRGLHYSLLGGFRFKMDDAQPHAN